jgi:hypothetical protein
MRDFDRDEVLELYAQHTSETGQVFDVAAIDRAFALTGGQPWLVNALGRQLVEVVVPDRAIPLSAAHVDVAADILVERQDTHLDSLAERLRDPRVRSVIEPMIVGGTLAPLPPDDLRFVLDLGLVREGADGELEVANPIYREIVARQLSITVRASLPRIAPSWLDAAGRIDFGALLDAFVAFWLRHGEALLGSSPYSEAAPHLVLMAFLHRVVNGGGRVEREYAIGSGRLDLCVEHHGDRLGVEIKTWRDSDKTRDPTTEGLVHLDAYLTRLSLQRGWLVVFDQRRTASALPERLRRERALTGGGRHVDVVRLRAGESVRGGPP